VAWLIIDISLIAFDAFGQSFLFCFATDCRFGADRTYNLSLGNLSCCSCDADNFNTITIEDKEDQIQKENSESVQY
jgi:hypothetical protein